jgi:L-malate glycosyltransferase
LIGPQTDAAYAARLRELAGGKEVYFHGALADAEVIARLGQAMALVHPTPVDAAGSAGVNELFGLALVEAMARGCPVVASEAASLPEIVEPEQSGLLVPPNDPAAIGRALERLRGDPPLWRALAAGARQRVEERFTWERVVDRCLDAYREMGACS